MVSTVLLLLVIAMSMEWASSESPYSTKYVPSPDRYNYFDAELLEVLTRDNTENVLLSPLGVKLGLAMLMEGASGKSADEISTALRLPVDSGDMPNSLQLKLYSLTQAKSPSHVLRIASRIFADENLTLNPSYRSSLSRKYGTDVAQVRFDRPRDAAAVLNNWVKNATSGMISKLADESLINANVKLMLANAMYYKGRWKTPFTMENTIAKCFETSTGECLMVPMMLADSGSYDYAYISKLDAYALSIPYEGDRFSMLLVLPKKKNGCAQLSRDMIHVTVEDVMSQLRRQEVRVEIPRFAVESHSDLIPHLEKLQILQVFTPGANLSGVSTNKNEKLLVNNVFHSAKLIVDETGTEAAASMGSLFIPLMGGTQTAFIANHPFLFFIRDSVTGTILFSGKIERPAKRNARTTSRHVPLPFELLPKEFLRSTNL